MHVNKINLYFTRAFEDYQRLQRNEKTKCPKDKNPFDWYLKQLRINLGKSFKEEDMFYWDLLFQVNVRGKDIDELKNKWKKDLNDPEKDKYIKDFVEGKYQKKIMILK
jgi:hypothetical protein